MTALRATAKVLRFLERPSDSVGRPHSALGDWFVDRFILDRQPLLILVNSASLLPIFEPARQLRTLPQRLPAIVHRRLSGLAIDAPRIAAEIDAMGEVQVAPTNDRSVLGTLVEFVRCSRYYSSPGGRWGREAFDRLEASLQKMPCRVTRPQRETVFPVDLTREILELRIH